MACKINLQLNNGTKMPALGFGTWQAPDAEVENALDKALEAGYRHIDCAPVYLNEKIIGNVLKRWIDSGKVKREELFIVTKLPPLANRASCVKKFLKKSLDDLKLDYVDVFLIHCPFGVPEVEGPFLTDDNGDLVLEMDTNHVSVWKEMEKMVNEGLTKTIGVSNFNQKQIQRLIDNSTIKPANLQVELHVYFQQKELVEFCKKNKIIVTAYAPLGSRGIINIIKGAGIEREIPDLFENVEVIKIGKRLNKTPAQILLRHILERGVAAIPKSTNFGRLQQNIDLFDFKLSDDDMTVLGNLDQGIRVCDFAFFKGADKHPEFPW